MDPVVVEMHTSSGLLEQIRSSTITVDEAGAATLEFLRAHIDQPRTVPLCGNSIGMDRRFLAAYLPEIEEFLHYRSVDVSTIKELARRWYPRVFFQAPEKHGGHRALADILESRRELSYYRSAVFIDAPGPSSDQARDIAAHRRRAPVRRPDADEDAVSFFDETRVPVEVIEVPAPESAGLAAGDYEIIAHKDSYRLAQRPGSYVVLKYRRAVIRLRTTGAITCAPAPA
jgi:oligoribonuclease